MYTPVYVRNLHSETGPCRFWGAFQGVEMRPNHLGSSRFFMPWPWGVLFHDSPDMSRMLGVGPGLTLASDTVGQAKGEVWGAHLLQGGQAGLQRPV